MFGTALITAAVGIALLRWVTARILSAPPAVARADGFGASPLDQHTHGRPPASDGAKSADTEPLEVPVTDLTAAADLLDWLEANGYDGLELIASGASGFVVRGSRPDRSGRCHAADTPRDHAARLVATGRHHTLPALSGVTAPTGP